jgi:hypothetical protein
MIYLFVKSVSICLLCFFSWAFSSSAFLLPRSNTCSNTNPRQRQRQRLKVFVETIGDIDETTDENNVLDDDRNNKDDDDDQNDDDDDTKNILTFQSTFQTKSKKLPQLSSSSSSPSSDLTLGDFLIDPQHLLRAGESTQMKIVPTTKELLEEWTIACHRVGAANPSPQSTPNSDNDDVKCFIVSVRTAGISIPGLTVEWSALIGTNLIDIDNHYPELELVLIKDETNVSSGSRPIVWIFNKLMKLSKKNKQNTNKNNNSIDTKLYTRLGFSSSGPNEDKDDDDDDDDDEESLVLRCNGTMKMKFRISTLIRKLAFSSSSKGGGDDEASHTSQKERSENLMSNIITKYIEKDIKQHINIWEESYISWINNTDT